MFRQGRKAGVQGVKENGLVVLCFQQGLWHRKQNLHLVVMQVLIL